MNMDEGFSDTSSSLTPDDEFDQDLNDRRGPRDSRDDFNAPSRPTGSMIPDSDDDSELSSSTDEDDPAASNQVIKNQPYDEAVEIGDNSDQESVPSHPSPSNNMQATNHSQAQSLNPHQDSLNMSGMSGNTTSMGSMLGGEEEEDEDDDSEEQVDESASENASSSSDGEDDQAPLVPEYDPDDYAHLNVSREIKQLFSMITAYKPNTIELDTKLQPFIPDYIPAVGDLDPFLKVPRPDGQPDNLGLKILDEPKAEQSDPTVIKMILSKSSTHLNAPAVKVRSIQEKDSSFPMQVQKWIDNIENVHKTNPAPTVNYKQDMPEIESLMQSWPPEYEEILSSMDLPSADIDLSTEEYAKVICSLLDIPVNDNPIESLHALFSLYLSFKQNNHFSKQVFGFGQ